MNDLTKDKYVEQINILLQQRNILYKCIENIIDIIIDDKPSELTNKIKHEIINSLNELNKK
jgi:hypothetical protein